MPAANSMNPLRGLALSLVVATGLVAIIGSGGGGSVTATPATDCVADSYIITAAAFTDNQTAVAGMAVARRLLAEVKCRSQGDGSTITLDAPSIDYAVTSGGGTVNGATVATSTNGVTWTLGPAVGQQTVSAEYCCDDAGPISLTFKATATVASSCDQATGGTDHGAIVQIATDTTWSAAGSPHRGGIVTITNGATLAIAAGALVCVQSIGSQSLAAGKLRAIGDAGAPIRFGGTALAAADDLQYVHGENVPHVGQAVTNHRVRRITDSKFVWTIARDPLVCAQVVVGGTHAEISRTTITDYGSQTCAALVVSATTGESVHVNARVTGSVDDAVIAGGEGTFTFNNCELANNSGDGLFVFAPGSPPVGPGAVSVEFCNLFGNGGAAISNQDTTTTVSAPNNWWGDPAGPGPGDTIGPVDATPADNQPIPLTY